MTSGGGGPVEERTDVPRTHAEALLDVTPGKVDYVRSALSIGSREVRIDRFVTPGPLDLITVDFDKEEDLRDFRPLPWFGPEVTGEAGYQNRSIALEGLPPALDVPLSNAALNTLLDTLEGRLGANRNYAPQKNSREGDQADQRRNAVPASERPAVRQAPGPSPEAASSEKRPVGGRPGWSEPEYRRQCYSRTGTVSSSAAAVTGCRSGTGLGLIKWGWIT